MEGQKTVNPIMQAHCDRVEREKEQFQKLEGNETDYHPLFRRATNDYNIDLMETQAKLQRSRVAACAVL